MTATANHTSKVAGCVRKYGLPYAVSTLATFVAALVVDAARPGDLVAIVVEWLAENGAFYAVAMLCGTFANSGHANEASPLRRLLAAEGLDTILRVVLLFAARQLPTDCQAFGAAAAGVLADISFCIFLAYSQHVWAIVDRAIQPMMPTVEASR